MGAPLSGTYTIGGTKPDFSTFSAATDALRNVGVCGPVIFNIRDGSYKEQIIIHSILGSSPANPITFQSQSLDSTKVTLETSSNNGLDKTHGYVLCLDGSSYITVRKMTIKNTWSGAYNYADAVLVENGALNCTFENNILISPASDNVGYTFDADQYSPENNIVVRNNIIKGGIYGISFKNYLFSIGLGFQSGNVAENNIVTGSVYQGILFYGQTNLSIVNNKVNLKDAKIGIYSSWNIDGIIVNNFVCMQGNTGIALRVDNTMSVDFYYNTLINNSTKDEAAWFFYPPSGCAQYFENNIVVNMGKGGALIMEKGSFLTSDYNDIYSAGSQLATWSQSNKLYACKTLADYQTTSGGYDLNSINADPNVSSVSSGDLHLTSSSTAVLKKGTPVYGVTDDIDGDYRPAKPDIGADQYSLDSNDIGISAIVSPTDFSCGTKSTSVGLLIKNYGYYPAVNFKVGIKIGGNYSDSLTYLFKDTLHGKSIKTGAHDTVIYLTFSPALNTSKGGSVDITAYTSFATDSNQWNDTVNASYSFYPSPRAAFGAKNICIGDSTKFKDISKAAGVPIVNYFWSFGNGDSSKNNRNPVELFKVSGTYNVHEIVTDLNGCTDTARQSIKIDSVDARFKYSGSSGGNINFAALDTISVKTYIWNFGDKSSPGNGSKITHPYASNGTYLVTLTKTNTSGCVASWSDSVAEVITGIETGNDLFDVSVYPNPFKFSTNIAYSLPAAGNVRIELFDMPGKRIKLLTDERQVAGEHELRFESGENYIGLYILKMTMGELTITKKIVILK